MNELQTLINVIKKSIRHSNYIRTVEKAELYLALITGENMKPYMKRFNKRESTTMFNQRCDITQQITSTVARNLIKPEYKVPRSNAAQRILAYTEDNENQKKNKFEKILKKFWGDESFDKWMQTRWIELNNTDPNTFIAIEWGEFDNTIEHASPYPFEISSEAAIMYEYSEKSILQYLISKNIIAYYNDEGDKKERTRYTLYGLNSSIVLETLEDDELKNFPNIAKDEIVYANPNDTTDSTQIIRIRNKAYSHKESIHDLGYVPAFMVGYNRDLYTDGVTKLSTIDDAVPILMKLVKANSELDLTMALHAFPQKIQLVRRCPAQDCNNGQRADGTKCPVCGGTGKEVHKTAQDVMWIEIPKNKEDVINFDNVIKYISPPVDLVKFQDQYTKDLTAYCKEALYNTEIFSKKQVAETATGRSIDLDNVYDALYPLAIAFSKDWKFGVQTIADITDLEENLVSEYIFNKDFKLKTKTDLYNDLKIVADSKGDDFIKADIQHDIARIMYTDDEQGYMKYQTERNFFPFSGKTEKEIAMLVSGDLLPLEIKVLWANFGWIFDFLALQISKDNKGINFYELDKSRQKKFIDKKIADLIKDIEKEIKDREPMFIEPVKKAEEI